MFCHGIKVGKPYFGMGLDQKGLMNKESTIDVPKDLAIACRLMQLTSYLDREDDERRIPT